MRISREEKEKLKDKILTEALPFLKKNGSAGAPVDQIMKQAGLTSGALYSHFKSKEDFFAQVVLKELENINRDRAAEYEKYGAKALPRFIEGYLSEAHLHGVEGGCVFASLGADMHRQKASVRAQYETQVRENIEILAKSLSGGSAEDRFHRAQFIFTSMVGAIVFARSLKSADAASAVLKSTKEQLLKIAV